MWTPTWPKEQYLLMKLYQHDNDSYGLMVYPLTFNNKKDMDIISKTLTNKYIGEITAKLQFNSTLPLLPEYWTENSAEFTPIRATMFENFIKAWSRNNQKWQIVVTPSSFTKFGQRFGPGMPIATHNPTKNKDIEAFMRYSDWEVDISATEAALYDVLELSAKFT